MRRWGRRERNNRGGKEGGREERRREGGREGGKGAKRKIREGAQAGRQADRQAGVLSGFVSLSGSGADYDSDTAAADSGNCNIGILGGGPTLPFARDTR